MNSHESGEGIQEPQKPKDVETFENAMRLLDSATEMVRTLRQYAKPERKVHSFTIPGMSRNIFRYPPTLGKTDDYSEIIVYVTEEDDEEGTNLSTTTIELHQQAGYWYSSRDPLIAENGETHFIDASGSATQAPRIPNHELNSLMYSIVNRPDALRLLRPEIMPSLDERVNGEGLLSALEQSSINTATDYTFTLPGAGSVWLRLEGSAGDESAKALKFCYKDPFNTPHELYINTESGLHVQVAAQGSEQNVFDQLHPMDTMLPIAPDEEDYKIILHAMEAVIAYYLLPIHSRPKTIDVAFSSPL